MDYAYYPGCSLEATGRPYDVSLRRVFERLGIGLHEIEDWNCCGATSYISMNKLTAYAISARNLAYAEKMGLDVCAPCSSCYTILSKVNRHMQWGEEHTKQHQRRAGRRGALVLGEAGGAPPSRHPGQLLRHREDRGEGRAPPRRAPHRALLRLPDRAAAWGGSTTARSRQPLDELFAALGGDGRPVPSKVRCCGGMLMTTYEEVALKLNRDILAAAARAAGRRSSSRPVRCAR